ncbi:hypothetical protein ACFQ9X_37485 [Catenulispora yoronensis]
MGVVTAAGRRRRPGPARTDERALLVRRALGERAWGMTSVSLVALRRDGGSGTTSTPTREMRRDGPGWRTMPAAT